MAKQKINSQQSTLPTIKRKDYTTNTTVEGQRMETGWGWGQFGSSVQYLTIPVTFNTAFTTRPIVLISPGGDAGNVAASYGTGSNAIIGGQFAKAIDITTTGFNAAVGSTSGTYSSPNTVYFQWIAVGA